MSAAIQEKTGLSRYFSREAILLALIIAVLPNVFFLAVMPFYIAHRMLAPTLYLAVGLVSLVLPRWAAYGLFLAAAAFDIITIMMLAFNLPLDVTLQSARDLGTIDVAASAFYMGFIAVIAGTSVLAAFLLGKYRASLRGASPVLAALTAFVFLGLNALVNDPYLSTYEGPNDSALAQLGLDADTIAAGEKNLLLVMVEGMGAFADPADRAILEAQLHAGTLPHHTMSKGTSYYQGSTTGSASRELCGRWGDFMDYLDGESYDCLPRQLTERGMETVAIHGFDIDMFRRDLWYPKIGFQTLKFKDALQAEHAEALSQRCGSVFNGLCDDALGPIVKAELSPAGTPPKMIYWLTLNSHIPFEAKANSPLKCGTQSAAIDDTQVCQLTELWGDVFAQVGAMAQDPDLPPTDILVMGDHHAPFWSRKSKKKFIHDKVDWYLMRDSRGKNAPDQLSSLPDETNL